MASLYKQPKSSFWWIKYRDPATSRIVRASTGLRCGVGMDTRRARELEAEKTLAERQSAPMAHGQWDTWVEPFLVRRASHLRTLQQYRSIWRTLRLFLREKQILAPQNLTYEHASAYLEWRARPDPAAGKYPAGRNTAIKEFAVLRFLMREAVCRGYAIGNPAREVTLKRAPRKVFPDFSDAQLREIAAVLQAQPDPPRTAMRRAFALALLHGVRLNETNVNPQQDVNLLADPPTIRFHQKGGRERFKPLHPQLVPLFQQLQNAGELYAMARSPNGRLQWNARWTRFFQLHFQPRWPHATFHSLRVTVANVLREAGIPKELRESYLSHEHARDVNAAYDRVKLRELLACHAPLARDWLPEFILPADPKRDLIPVIRTPGA